MKNALAAKLEGSASDDKTKILEFKHEKKAAIKETQ